MLTNVELRELSVLQPWRAILAILLDWCLIGLTFMCAIRVAHPVVYFISALLIGRTQLALGIMMHDGVHCRLCRNRKINDYVGQFLTAGPVLFSFFSYRRNHLKHHQDPLVPDDPDITLTGGYPVTRKSFARKLLRDLFGISYFKFVKYFLYGAHVRRKSMQSALSHSKDSLPSETMPLWMVVVSMVLANFFIFGVLFYLGHPWLYFGLWILPALTLVQLLLRIRGIAEHAGYAPNPNQMLNARTIDRSSWETFFFAPHKVHYHIEHHQYVSIPFYNLEKAHELLAARGSLQNTNVYKGYKKIVEELVL